MQKEIIIGKRSLISLVVIAIDTQIFLNYPRIVAQIAGTAGWLLALYTGLISIALFAVINRLYRGFDGMDVLDAAKKAAGKPGLIFTGLIICAYLIFITPVYLREFAEYLKVISLDATPLFIVTFFLAAGMVTTAFLGIETLARMASILLPVIITLILFIGIGVSQFNDISNIAPFLGLGPRKIFLEGLSRISIYSGIIVLFLCAPFVKTAGNFKSVGYIGLGISTLFLVISSMAYSFVFPYPASLEYFLPIYQLSSLINYGFFFQRIEAVFLLIWVTSALIYLSVAFFLILRTFKKTFGLISYRPLIPAFMILVFTLSLIPENLIRVIEMEELFRNTAWLVAYGLTLTVFAAAKISEKIKRKGEKA